MTHAAGPDRQDEAHVSVAEMQQALRALKARKAGGADAAAGGFVLPSEPLDAAPSEQPGTIEAAPGAQPASAPGETAIGELHTEWVVLLGAHGGTDSALVALAVGDAAAQSGRRVQLIETAEPARSGLANAAGENLGTDATRAWLRGGRNGMTLDRRAPGEVTLAAWPLPPPGGVELTLVDLGTIDYPTLHQVAASGARVIVVCRATVPGLRLTEQVLAGLTERHVSVAAIGPAKWPRKVSDGRGPILAGLLSIGQLVIVPTDRRIETAGPSPAALPRPILDAGRALLGLVDGATHQP